MTAAIKPPITRAMLLGAGMGSRMRDLTTDRPKPMVEVAGRPLVDHVLDRLEVSGITDAVVNVHYCADVLETHLSQRTSPTITISDERSALLDTGGGVTNALPLLGVDPFFIHNADAIWIENNAPALDVMRKTWDSGRMDTLMLLANPTTSLGYDGAGDFTRTADGRIKRRALQDSDAAVFAGVSIAHPRLFASPPTGSFSLNVLWDRAIAAGRAYGVMLDGQWMHVGTPEAVHQANALIADSIGTAP